MSAEDGFKIKTEKFEGPIDLLIDLIEKRKLHISEISLAEVANEYIVYIENLENLPLDETAQFLVIASTLLLIKSRSLLPALELSEEESASIEDLEHRLTIYQNVRVKAKLIEKLFGKMLLFPAEENKERAVVFSPSQDLSLANLTEAMNRLIANLPEEEKLSTAVVKKVVSLEEVIKDLSNRIERHLKMSFKDFAGLGKRDKVDVAVSFLALLELVKQGLIAVRQHNHFADIEMETEKYDVTPKYN